MLFFRKILVLFFVVFLPFTSLYAQNADDTQSLIKQGIALHNQGKYPEAIEKFKAALKTGPENAYANYELAFSLYASKKPAEAIPYLEKATKTDNAKLSVPAWCLLGSIYDEAHQTQKAIDAYDAGIKTDPDYPQIFYNKGIAYFRNQQYAEAEACAINAIKHDPKNASSQRMYALVAFHQNKRMNALLGFCSFLLLEPNTARSAEAYNNIQSILKGGLLGGKNGSVTIPLSSKEIEEISRLNLIITTITTSAQTKKLEGMAQLEYELKSIFTLAGQLAEKKTDKTFFDTFFAAYFYKLAQSDNVPAFAKLVVNKTVDAGLNDWLKITERKF